MNDDYEEDEGDITDLCEPEDGDEEMSDTPRTDEEAELRGGSLLVRADFARKLERELNAALAVLQSYNDSRTREDAGGSL